LLANNGASCWWRKLVRSATVDEGTGGGDRVQHTVAAGHGDIRRGAQAEVRVVGAEAAMI
jgi:hypothetical protein